MERQFGQGGYQNYFTDQPNNNAPVNSLEFIHYNDILRDEQTIKVGVYRANKELHIQCLLRKLMPVFDCNGISCRL